VRRKLLGLAVLLGALLAAVLLWQRPDPFSADEVVRADVRDANGLAPIGADVRVAGVLVGKVTAVARDGSLARLTLTLDGAVGTVHRDATVDLRPRMMFEGTAYVELTLGSPRAPALGADVLPASQSSTYVPLDDAISVISPKLRVIAAAAGHTLSGQAPRQLRDAIAASPRLTRDVGSIAGAANPSTLRGAVYSLAHVAGTVASQAPALGASLDDAARTAQAIDSPGLQPTLASLPATAASLTTGGGAASSILAALGPLLPRLQPGVAALAPTLAAVRPLLRQSVPVTTDFRPILADSQTVLTGALNGAAPALGAIHALKPTLDIYQQTLLPALAQQTSLGDPAYLAFLGLFAGGGGASRPFGVAGQGHFMRFGLRFLTGVGLPLPPCSLLGKVAPALAATLAAAGACTP
jgi:ABC-type transporter Mla subunit MlaD